MILVWDNVNSFKRHLEDMRSFRHSHNNTPLADLNTLKDMPMPFNVTPPNERGLIKSIYDSKGKIILAPIWQVTPAKGMQN